MYNLLHVSSNASPPCLPSLALQEAFCASEFSALMLPVHTLTPEAQPCFMHALFPLQGP